MSSPIQISKAHFQARIPVIAKDLPEGTYLLGSDDRDTADILNDALEATGDLKSVSNIPVQKFSYSQSTAAMKEVKLSREKLAARHDLIVEKIGEEGAKIAKRVVEDRAVPVVKPSDGKETACIHNDTLEASQSLVQWLGEYAVSAWADEQVKKSMGTAPSRSGEERLTQAGSLLPLSESGTEVTLVVDVWSVERSPQSERYAVTMWVCPEEQSSAGPNSGGTSVKGTVIGDEEIAGSDSIPISINPISVEVTVNKEDRTVSARTQSYDIYRES